MTAQTKIDPSRELDGLYHARSHPAIVDVPDLAFLMIDGHGDPNTSPAYSEAVEALFSVAYAAKFLVKEEPAGINFKVMPLEGLWWSGESPEFDADAKSTWDWTMMIMQPEQVGGDIVARAVEGARRRRSLAALGAIRHERFTEGLCAQLLHIGPYAEEGPTIARLHGFIGEQGYLLRGKHHEIYLGDPRRAAPEKLRTIIRQPIAPAA